MVDSTSCGEGRDRPGAETALTSADLPMSRGVLLAESASYFFGTIGDVTQEQADVIRERCRRRQERVIEALKASERSAHLSA